MSQGGIFQLITNNGKQDHMLIACEFLKRNKKNQIKTQNIYIIEKIKDTFWSYVKWYPSKECIISGKDITNSYKSLSLDDVGLVISQLNIDTDNPLPVYDKKHLDNVGLVISQLNID